MTTIKERRSTHPDTTAAIRLKGEPYHRQLGDETIDCTDTLEIISANTNYEANLPERIAGVESHLQPLFEGGYYGIDRQIKKGQSLSFDQAFSLMAFVSMGTNQALHRCLSPRVGVGATDPETVMYQSVALLSAMSAKEAYAGLTPSEIAGLTAAVLHLDTIVRVPSTTPVYGLGGMGGDRGYPINSHNSKLFSLSTMGAALLADFGPVHKHHSYPNTSKVAGQTAIEALGARSDHHTLDQFVKLQEQGLLMTSCHTLRTIHTLSHRLKGETINHIVGPLALPVEAATPVNALIGVNDNVHPESVIQALQLLQQHTFQCYSNSVAFCGLNIEAASPDLLSPDSYYASRTAREAVAIDEVAPPPYPTVAAFLVEGQNRGTFVITPSDFLGPDYHDLINLKDLLIENGYETILQANHQAITGQETAKTLYLAMTAALALFTKEYSHLPTALNTETHTVNPLMLQECLRRVLSSIYSGNAYNRLNGYIAASQAVLS